ncbi:non-ribosomal peptide synthetase [Streptomyces sp. CB02261]|uniref:non-ribosomal peptide synthetase n=1 Tax=Streptomyces sp. CB02261 TaxID=1703940 RepID=UPI00093CA5A8|nr:non-ribosomal peptide synthetase [Streptomyces sp. CB02261]
MYAHTTVVDVIRRNVSERGAALSYEFLADAGGVDTELSMLEIDRRARAIAVTLLERAKPGARVMLLYPPGEHFVVGFVATLYAGMVAVPVYPPDPMRIARTLPRLRAVVAGSRAEIVLSDSLVQAFTHELFEQQAPEVARLPWVITEDAMREGADEWRRPDLRPDSIALLQYTSGSTGTPRGVVVTHGNLLSNGSAIAAGFGITEGDVVASWLPFYHDMGLLGGVLQPMLSGLSNVLMSPLEFMRRPMRWLEAISSRGATVSGGPNFAFDLCVNKSTPAEREALDLSSWRVAFCGAEPVRHRTLERFAEAFAPSGFDRSALLPCYGLAEATLFVAGSGRGNGAHTTRLDRAALEQGRAEPRADGDLLVSSGVVAENHELAVVDPETGARVAPGAVGELWVRGTSVAAGYWEDEAATEAAFGARLADDERPYLRTGDLGFVLDGQIHVTGRLKEMMVVRGRNLYAHDLEETAVAASPWARPGCGAAFSVETEDGEECVVLHEVAVDTPEDELPRIADAIAAAVQHEHGIALADVVLLAARSLAKTSSGKIQRLAGRTAYTAGQVEGELYRRSASAPARGEKRQLVLPTRAELLALPRAERVDVIERALSMVGRGEGDAPATMVAELDLDSLAAVDLAFRIEEQLGVVTDPGLLLQPTTLREVATAVEERAHTAPEEQVRQEPDRRGGAVPLSAGQQSLLFMRDLEGPDCLQNVSVAVRLHEPVDTEVLAAAVRHIGARHPVLTARFGTDGSRRTQLIDPAVPFELDVVDLSGEAEPVLRARVDACALAPFAVEDGDVARAKLFTGCGAPVLVLAQHHAITDFWSVVVLLDELTSVYGDLLHERAPELPAAVGYEEFVRWQQDYERSPQWQADERYWLDLLSGDVQAPTLPVRERPRPEKGIASHRVTVDAELLAELERVAGDSGTTVFSVLMAAFEVLVAAHSGARDFVVGATTAGRPQARFRNTLGYFVNTIPVRAEPGAHRSVTELIRSTGEQLRQSLGHQHFPVSRLVELLRARGNTSAAINTAVVFERPHNAIADDVTSVLFGAGRDSAVLGDLTLAPFPAGELATQFDITLHAVPADGGLLAHMLVRADRFDESLATSLGEQFLELLGQIVTHGDSPVSALRLAGATESLTRADVPARTLPGVTSVHELFEATADRTPDAVALTAGSVELTYAQVERAANRLAHRLRQDGLGPEDTVGLCLERSSELIVAMLAVMKSGAAFVPLDPTLPQSRLADMVGDARCARILCHGATADLAGSLGTAIRVDEEPGADLPEDRPALAVGGDNLAYVIFTSGSTGRPKGVQIEHRSLVSYLLSFLDAFDVVEGDRVLQFAPLTFDPCLEEIFSAWTRGASLVLRDESVLGSPERFWAWCEEQRLTLVDIPTAFFHVLVTALEAGARVPSALRSILIGGEAAHPDKLAQWFAADRGHVELYNRWGTTETTVCSTVAHLGPESGQVSRARDVSIGADMTDAVIHVLDAELRPVADGVVGEAYIGGVGVGRGYASAPRKTAERFVPDPFATEPGRRLYATGDLVRRSADGELRYVGRADQQVKVRGYRIELGEVDVALRRHPEVAEAAVVATRGTGETELIAAVTGEGVGVDGLRDWLNRELPSYMVPSRLLVLDAIPLTSNGKVDAHALRELALDASRSAGAADMSPLESRLAAIWCEVLEVAGVGPDEDFFALGGHSLRAADLNTRVRREFGVRPPLRMFFESVTVRAQAARIAELAETAAEETNAGETAVEETNAGETAVEKTYAGETGAGETGAAPESAAAAVGGPALSLGQRRLWFLEKFAPGSRAYVVPGVLRLYGELDPAVLRGALDAIVERHPALRTGFTDEGGRPVPFVHTGLPCPFEVIDRTAVPAAQREAELAALVGDHVRQLFRLDEPPLMRAALVEFGPDEHALLLAFHHIVSDGRSMEIIAGELAELYAHGTGAGHGEPPAVVHEYARWAADETARLESAEGRRGLEFWTGHLGGAPLALDLPFDRPRPAVQTFDGSRVPLTLSQADSDLLRSLAREQGATVFMTLAACMSSTLSRLTGQERVVVGVPDANRTGDGTYDDVVGFFVNTVPLCFEVPAGATGRDLVDRARATTLETMPYQWVPFSAIVEATGQDRDPSRSPLFQAILDVRNGALPTPALPGLRVETAPLYTGTAKTDLTFEITDDGGPLTGWLEFNTDLFRPGTAQLIARLFGETARAMAQRPDERVATPAAVASLDRWPAEPGDGQQPDTFWAQFERIADSRADAVALEGPDSALTYGELRTRVDRVAGVIARRFAVRPGDVVAVSVEPSVEAVVAVLAAQRCGAAYLPIDPAYPAERKEFMLADSGARGLVTRDLVEEALSDALTEGSAEEALTGALADAPAEAVALPEADPDAPAYLLYTSGSTGRPKGVLVSHRALANLTAYQARVFGIDADARMLQFASLSFDASVWEIFSTLAAGGTLVVAGREHALVGEALADVLAERAVSVCLLPPSVIASLPVRELPRLTTLVSGGEACRAELVERWQPGRRFVNAYGPTECTVVITAAACEPGRPASLGAVLPGGTAYVLDAELRPVVTGAVGELYVGGAGLALGYHGRPGLTAGHFLPDPFSAVPGARMYRTGDLVRLRADGTLDYCGRHDSQIKLRGYRIEPAEVESVLLALTGVTQAVVRGVDGVLVAHVEATDPELTPRALAKLCAAELPPHLVPAAFVVRGELPRLPGGKIDPARLGRPGRADFALAEFAALETETERTVGRVWAQVLDVDMVGAGDDFFTIGGHSLLATVITSQVSEELGREVPLRALFEAPVLRDYAALCDAAAVRDTSGGIAAHAAGGSDAPLSVMQERLWLLEEIENGSGENTSTGRYHLAGAIRLTGELDEAALQRAVTRLVDRHTTLRTVVAHRDGELTQAVLDSADVVLTRTELAGATAEERASEARALVAREAAEPMDLAGGPLLRVRLLQLGHDDAVLVLTLHHIVGDGWSMEILKRDLTHFYAEETGHEPSSPLPPLAVTYEQFSRWQRHQLDSGALDASVAYWCEQLDALPSLSLPVTRGGAEPAADRGHRTTATVTPELREAMERLAVQSGATLFMVLAATLQITLGRLAGQRDFAIGVPIAGRRHREVEDLIGFFINSLVLRADLSGDPTFDELLQRVRSRTLDAYEHQDVPFETLVGKLAPERDLNTTPLFQVYLNLLNIPPRQGDLPGLAVDTFAVPDLGAKFDLTFYVDPAQPGLSLDLMYAADRFDRATVDELLAQWIRVIEQAVTDSGSPIDSLRLDTPLARRALPNPAAPLDTTWYGSVVEQFERRAAREPHRIALTEPGQELTYGELAWATAAMSGLLNQQGIAKGDVVAIYGERSASLVWAILSVLRAGASFAILDPSYPADRIADCLAVARPSAFLQLEGAGAVPLAVDTALQGASLRCRFELPSTLADARHLVPRGAEPAEAVPVGPEDCAYIAFTSGSTGKPKGIRGAHGSLTHFVPWMVETFGLRETDRYSLLSGISHDPLHREVFTPLVTGATICVPDRLDVETPGRLAQWFRTAQVSVSHMTPPMARLFDQLSVAPGTLPLLERVFFLGDTLTSRDVRAITRMAGSATCVNLYGSTETQRAVGYHVVPAAHGVADTDPGVTYPLGRGMKDVQLLVLNEAGHQAGVGEPGEIVIRSPHISLGYAHDEALTAARFVRSPFGDTDGDRMYRTGDLGRHLPDGCVVPLGRADTQVKIRGYRVETDEVQHVICAAPDVQDALVMARADASGENALVAYVVSRPGTRAVGNDVKAFVRKRLPDYMVPAFVVALDAFPLTPNRKIDRAALPEPSSVTGGHEEGPRTPLTPTEELVAGLWQDVLGAPRVGPEDNFFNLGGHSLMATQVVSRIRRVFGCEIALRTLFEKQTVRDLAAHIDGVAHGASETAPVVPLPRTGPLPASYGQERLWFLDQLEGDTGAYNSSTVVRMRGPLDTEALAVTLDELVARHEVLRTRLVMDDGRVSQIVEPAGTVTMPLTVVDLSGEPEETAEQRWLQLVDEAARHRFDLAEAPLEQATLIRLSDEDHVFVLAVHHVVADGWGLQIVVRDFAALYQAHRQGTASSLPELDVQYADWSSWQRERVEGGDHQAQLDFWCETLAKPAPLLEFPSQRPRPAAMTNRGLTIRRVLDPELVGGVRQVGREHNATLFMTLLAAFNCQLHRYSGAADIAVATPVGTRSVEIEDVVGFFVNTIVFRNTLAAEESFTELLERVRSTTLAAYANQDVPFDRVVDALQPSRDLSTSPLFQVMFTLHNAPYSEIDLGDLRLERLHAPTGTAKFDLSLDLAEEKDGLHATLELNADLFDEETGRTLLDHFEALLGSIAAAPERPVADLELRPAAEAAAQDALSAGPEAFTPMTTTESLAHWARLTPDAPAVIDGDTVWTYRELRDRVAALAGRLSTAASGPEPAVVVCAGRSARHIAAALACDAAGATYVPVSPAVPDRRIASVLDRLGEVVALTDDEQAERVAALLGEDRGTHLVLDDSVSDRPLDVRGTHPARRSYVIFTSGTTGEPKGVEIEQAGLLNHLELMAHDLELTSGDVIAQTASQSFDISVWQMLVAVTRGAATVVSDDATSRDAEALLALVRRRRVSMLQLVPGMIRALLDHAEDADLASLRHLIATGEALPPDLAADWLRRFPRIPMVNAYGPAECSDDTHLAVLTTPPPTDRAVTLGSPVAGVTSYVLDAQGRRLPFGVPGELAIGGPVVGRGYLGDPKATAERFVPDPYGAEPGARLYRTGDRVRLGTDGRLEFLGRLDDQLKIRGFRIEAGEVETALCELPAVREAAVVLRDCDGEPTLVACVVGTEHDPAVLAAAVGTRLPRYMVPTGYVFADRLPRTPNGKVDRAALQRDDVTVERVRRRFEELSGPTERLVASVFEELLGTPAVGALDDFFTLGGHSLLATRLVAELAAQTDIELPLRAVFEQPTVRGVAQALEALQLAGLSEAELLELEVLLDGVTDDQARELLAAGEERDA